MRRTDHQLHPEHFGLRSRGVVAVGSRLIAVTLVVGLATFAATVLPAESASAVSTSVRSTLFQALLAKLKDPAATAINSFGWTVAVSRTTAVVGAPDANSSAGAAYLYVTGASGWPTTPTTTLEDPTAPKEDSFGVAVAVSGTTAVVGASGANRSAGAAYIYVKGASSWPTTPTTTLEDPAATRSDYFGSSVAVTGTTAIVGAPEYRRSGQGAAYIYVKGASGWPTTPTATLKDPAARDDSFGVSVAVSETTAIVSAPRANRSAGTAYIYVKGASGWPTTPTATLKDPAATAYDDFGSSVAVSGTTAVVGDDTNSSAGAAYLYLKGASGWPTTPTATLKDPAATAKDFFGSSVAVSGTTAIVCAPGANSFAGTAYIYVKGASGWQTTPTTKLKNPAATADNDFGSSLAVSGTTAVVGAPEVRSPGRGVVYIYVKGASGWPTKPTAKLKDPKATVRGDLQMRPEPS